MFFPQFCFLFKSNFLLKFLLFYFAAAVVKWCFEDNANFAVIAKKNEGVRHLKDKFNQSSRYNEKGRLNPKLKLLIKKSLCKN